MSFQRIVLAGALLAVFPVFPMFGQCMNPYVTVSLTTHADETQWVRITSDRTSVHWSFNGVSGDFPNVTPNVPFEQSLGLACMTTSQTYKVWVQGCESQEISDSVSVPAPDLQPTVRGIIGGSPQVDPHSVLAEYSFPYWAANRTIIATFFPTHGTAGVVDQGNLWAGNGLFPIHVSGDADGMVYVFANSCNDKFAEDTILLEAVQNQCKGCDGSCPAATECVGGPVHTYSGNMVYADVDPLPSDGFLPFRRTYHSRKTYAGFFGLRWYSLFDARLYTYVDGRGVRFVSVATEDQTQHLFRGNGSGFEEITPGANRKSLLVELPNNGGWVQTDATGRLRRTFDGAGFPLSYEDVPSGREVRIFWGGGVPVRLEDGWGNWALTITADAIAGRITDIEVEGHPDLVWHYVYDTMLTRVDSPEGVWRSYEYGGGGSPRLTSAKDGAGNVIESHGYEYGSGRAIASWSASALIDFIQLMQPGRGGSEYKGVVQYHNGRVETHYRRWVAGAWRTGEVVGGCTGCGIRNKTVVYDIHGNAVKTQEADGYVTLNTYDVAGINLLSSRTALRPFGMRSRDGRRSLPFDDRCPGGICALGYVGDRPDRIRIRRRCVAV